MFDAHFLNLALHVGAGAAGILSGFVLLGRTKGYECPSAAWTRLRILHIGKRRAMGPALVAILPALGLVVILFFFARLAGRFGIRAPLNPGLDLHVA